MSCTRQASGAALELFGHLKVDPPSVRHALRRVENLYGNEVSPVVRNLHDRLLQCFTKASCVSHSRL